jgi:hypothetical protein
LLRYTRNNGSGFNAGLFKSARVGPFRAPRTFIF